MTADGERLDAYVQLLARPDRFDELRAHALKQAGKPERFAMYRDLPMRYTVIARHSHSQDPAKEI